MHDHPVFRFLLFSTLVNYAVLVAWFLLFVNARGWMRRLHGRWFALPDATFDAIHYGGMAAYKIGILLFNLVPLLALLLLRHGR
jgi:hypothetical protein